MQVIVRSLAAAYDITEELGAIFDPEKAAKDGVQYSCELDMSIEDDPSVSNVLDGYRISVHVTHTCGVDMKAAEYNVISMLNSIPAMASQVMEVTYDEGDQSFASDASFMAPAWD